MPIIYENELFNLNKIFSMVPIIVVSKYLLDFFGIQKKGVNILDIVEQMNSISIACFFNPEFSKAL